MTCIVINMDFQIVYITDMTGSRMATKHKTHKQANSLQCIVRTLYLSIAGDVLVNSLMVIQVNCRYLFSLWTHRFQIEK